MSRPAAEYVVRVQFRVQPAEGRIDPQVFDTHIAWPAPPPGEAGWLWFRDHLWRGELADRRPVRERAAATLGGHQIDSVSFSELQTTEVYLERLETAIESGLDDPSRPFGNAESVDDVLRKYLGSSIRIRTH